MLKNLGTLRYLMERWGRLLNFVKRYCILNNSNYHLFYSVKKWPFCVKDIIGNMTVVPTNCLLIYQDSQKGTISKTPCYGTFHSKVIQISTHTNCKV